MKGPGLVFHSFRKNLATALHGLGVADSVVSDLLGHEHETLSFRLYSEGSQLRTLYEALARVEYGLAIELDGVPSAAAPGCVRRAGGRATAAPMGPG